VSYLIDAHLYVDQTSQQHSRCTTLSLHNTLAAQDSCCTTRLSLHNNRRSYVSTPKRVSLMQRLIWVWTLSSGALCGASKPQLPPVLVAQHLHTCLVCTLRVRGNETQMQHVWWFGAEGREGSEGQGRVLREERSKIRQVKVRV